MYIIYYFILYYIYYILYVLYIYILYITFLTKAACCRNIEIVLHPATDLYLMCCGVMLLLLIIYIYILIKIKFSENKVLNVVDVELCKQL